MTSTGGMVSFSGLAKAPVRHHCGDQCLLARQSPGHLFVVGVVNNYRLAKALVSPCACGTPVQLSLWGQLEAISASDSDLDPGTDA